MLAMHLLRLSPERTRRLVKLFAQELLPQLNLS
jgi:hypothetical protein